MFEIFTVGPVSTNCIVLYCKKTKECAIIDPGLGSFEKIKAAVEQKGLNVKRILLTHSHWDHIADLAKVKRFYNVDVYVHEKDANNVLYPGSDSVSSYGIEIEKIEDFKPLNEGDILPLGTFEVKVLHTPGHSYGSCCFYAEKDHLLISGDTLFHHGHGRLDLATSEKEKMMASLKRLAKLPPQTQVVSGHGPQFTIEEEDWLKNIKI
jgi:glyoxylase-like metal-dependent hydrolase (beta-lactamase superfamily II)